ncbi:hypothetical protein [Pseudanabaena sp. ABRG5-3]|uniref:hypothetical protein n=1 Tax=Pseudanabaena sp. ABRG5-3 TaxID=685565 RepID=UPI000DC726C6|nr:hypothetical protein [Pseudanabaena sp. ABRG5-3]BBC26953.1 hypothetical protein ABRG53_c114 [Pseudanabaena sp. ABRG5-3]
MKASHYWQFVKLKATGLCIRETSIEAREFLLAQFPAIDDSDADLTDLQVQKQLWRSRQSSDRNETLNAELCLRCFISNQIEQTCYQIANQFGTEHGFKYNDLLVFVLNDVIASQRDRQQNQSTFISVAREILDSFDPELSNLATWTNRKVKQNRELNAFLLEHGVYLVSDWAILNDTSPKQLERIYTEFYQTAQYSIQQAKILLEAYHAVYRLDRLQSRLNGSKGQCPPPTADQLQRMSEYLGNHHEYLAPAKILNKLQEMASNLRQYRIQARGGKPAQVSLDQPNLTIKPERLFALANEENDAFAFLNAYRQQFEQSLEQAIAKVIDIRSSKIQQRSPENNHNFLTGLSLFHCHGQTMSEIATAVGLEAQYQVTRLLKLKELRADIRREILGSLREQVMELVKFYTDPTKLDQLDQKLEVILEELVTEEMELAEAESIKSKGIPLRSRFAIKLCQYLQQVHQC